MSNIFLKDTCMTIQIEGKDRCVGGSGFTLTLIDDLVPETSENREICSAGPIQVDDEDTRPWPRYPDAVEDVIADMKQTALDYRKRQAEDFE